jgi:hypothetical protein
LASFSTQYTTKIGVIEPMAIWDTELQRLNVAVIKEIRDRFWHK